MTAIVWALLALAVTACNQGKPDQSALEPVKSSVDQVSKQEAGNGRSEEKLVALTPQERADEGIVVEALTPRPVTDTIELTAVIQPNQNRLAKVAPRVSARIVAVDANLGDRVRVGQRLALLDSVEVGEAHAAFLQARSELEVTRANLDRAESLYADQIIAQKDYLRARGEYQRAETALHAAEDRLRILGIEVPVSNGKSTSVFPLRAPFSGTIIEKDAVLGELANPERPLFTLADLRVLWIEADLYERDLGRVGRGAQAEVRVAAYPDRVFPGRLTYISEVMQRETRTAKARIEVENAEGLLKPEMFATARIETSASRSALSVPSEAVVLIGGKPVVFIEENGRFEPREVATGQEVGGRIVLASGADEGESVVVRGAYALKARMLKSELGEGH